MTTQRNKGPCCRLNDPFDIIGQVSAMRDMYCTVVGLLHVDDAFEYSTLYTYEFPNVLFKTYRCVELDTVHVRRVANKTELFT